MSKRSDDIPAFLKISQAKRDAAWQKNPPRAADPVIPAPPPVVAEFVERKKNKTTTHFAKFKIRREASAIPEEFRRWDPRKGKFVDERVDWQQRLQAAATRLGITLENSEMSKLTIIPHIVGHMGEDQPASRGKTSIKADAAGWEIQAAVRKAAIRVGKKLQRVEVVSPDGLVSDTWTLDSESKTLQNGSGEAISLADEVKTSSPSEPKKESTVAKRVKVKAAKKSNGNGAEPRVGVISTIVEAMKRKSGVTIEECVAILAKKFPDRKQKSMTSTSKIQLAKNAKSKEKTEGRGLIYYA